MIKMHEVCTHYTYTDFVFLFHFMHRVVCSRVNSVAFQDLLNVKRYLPSKWLSCIRLWEGFYHQLVSFKQLSKSLTIIQTKTFHSFCSEPVEVTAGYCAWSTADAHSWRPRYSAQLMKPYHSTSFRETLGSQECCVNMTVLFYLMTYLH